ncbi:unnamed protein product [Blepharisma stoltei]|uniref:BZIP domain-containing protein n=1 Tax=Blepharisma stoltei TaxID=1481888 RepID=A0AAU9JNB0_9CILI|nr:unnamed protein product [Blepharisma stoltei]
MEWNLDSHVLGDDIFLSFLNVQEPFFDANHNFIAPRKEKEIETHKPIPDAKRLRRLAKNRLSARNTRNRKKQNLQYLESRVASLTEEVESLRQEARDDDKISDEVSEQLRSERQMRFAQLKTLLETEGHDEQIQETIDTLRIKMGVDGVERQGYIEYVMRQISSIFVPELLKSLLNVVSNRGIILMISPSITPEQLQNAEAHLQAIEAKKEAYDSCLKNLKRIQKCLLRRTGHLQSIIDTIATMLTPRQQAALLIRLNDSGALLDPFDKGVNY